jgi:hypothetical protein
MATINPRTLFRTFLAAPKPTALVNGASRPGQPSAIGRGIWQINSVNTFNANINSVPLVLHNIISNSVTRLVYPEYSDTVVWFDRDTAAFIGLKTYGSNRGSTATPWILEMTKATQLPNSSLTVNYLTSATVWQQANPVTTTFRLAVASPVSGMSDPYRVGSSVSLPGGNSLSVRSSIATVGINNVLRLRYNLAGVGSLSAVSGNFDFYFNVTTGFIYADFLETITNSSFNSVDTIVRWTAVSGF